MSTSFPSVFVSITFLPLNLLAILLVDIYYHAPVCFSPLECKAFERGVFGLFHSTPHPGPWHNVWHTEELLSEIWNDHE